MGRPAKHAPAQILDAAAAIVASRGLSAATIGAIGHAIGAPSGSIYHRFASRDELLGALWLRTAQRFQDAFAAELTHDDPVEAGLHGALSIARIARQDLASARIMLLHRREDFLSGDWPKDLAAEAERLGTQAKDELVRLTRRLFGGSARAQQRIVMFATLDIPYAAVRRYLVQNERPPVDLDRQIETAYRAVIADATPD